MKKVLLLMFCALMSYGLSAQFNETFSDYTVGGKIAQQAQEMGREYWNTWSFAPGGPEDGVVAELNGEKVGFWAYPNDQILLLGDKDQGKWMMSMKMWIPAGKCGYFNIMADWAAEKWALQVYIGCKGEGSNQLTPGVGTIHAGGANSAGFTFTHDAWTDVKVFIDLDNDWAEIFVDGVRAHAWQYSAGTFGDGNYPKIIEMLDIYPPKSNGDSEFYIDNVFFNEVTYITGFDDKPNNSYVAESYPEWWQTWEDNPGTSEDALITNEKYLSSGQSAKCTYGTDLIFKAGDQTEGGYFVDFDMYIPAGARGYFNLLQEFDGEDSEWAVGVYFNVTTNGGPQAGTYVYHDDAATNFTFPYDTWFPVSIYVDLDMDNAYIYINDNLILEWQYSIKEDGEEGDTKLAAVNFFPPETGGTFYIDNFTFSKAAIPPAPPTLSVDTEELSIRLKQDNVKTEIVNLVSEEEGTMKALWVSYVEYSEITNGEEKDFAVSVCNPSDLMLDGGLGMTEPQTTEIGMILAPEFFMNEVGGEIKEVGYYILSSGIPNSDLHFRVYGQGMTSTKNGDQLAEGTLSMANFVPDAWNFATIDPPIKLTGESYWITVTFLLNGSNYGLTVDNGPLHDGFGNLIRDAETGSTQWSQQTGYGNWAIQARGDGLCGKVWGTSAPVYGSTSGGTQSEIAVTVNSFELPEDTYKANVVIKTNVETYPRFEIPLTMVVSNEEPDVNADVEKVLVNDLETTLSGSDFDFGINLNLPWGENVVNIEVIPVSEVATVSGGIGEQPIDSTEIAKFNYFTVTVTAEAGNTQDYVIRVGVQRPPLPPAISEVDNTTIKLYPNPVRDYLTIQSEYTIETLVIYDLTGKMVKEIKQISDKIDLSDLSTGYYLLRVTTSEGEAMHKFIKE